MLFASSRAGMRTETLSVDERGCGSTRSCLRFHTLCTAPATASAEPVTVASCHAQAPSLREVIWRSSLTIHPQEPGEWERDKTHRDATNQSHLGAVEKGGCRENRR